MEDQQQRPRRRTWSIGAIIVGITLAIGATAAPVDANGGNREKVTVSGSAVPSDCNDGEGVAAIELSGSLEGCLTFFVDSFTCEELNGFARYQERGRETFVGSIDGRDGTFRTRYTLDATFNAGSCAEFEAGGFPALDQITGGCQHLVVGGTGSFKRARGLITIFDVIPDPGESGASSFLYAGDLRLRR